MRLKRLNLNLRRRPEVCPIFRELYKHNLVEVDYYYDIIHVRDLIAHAVKYYKKSYNNRNRKK